MMDRGSKSFPARRVSSLHLDYGADSQFCDQDAVELSERGLRVRSRWQFEVGTRLSVAIVGSGADGEPSRMTAEGIVVHCESLGVNPCLFESTLLFLEIPDELRQSLRDFSYGLTAGG